MQWALWLYVYMPAMPVSVYSLHVQTTLSTKESIAAEQMTLPVVDKPVSKRSIKRKKQEIQYIPSLLMYRVLITDIIR